MAKTKKVDSTGRFGSRYGVGIRKRLLKVELKQKKADRRCPNCGSKAVKRRAKGIFNCRKCGHEFVGGAYLTQTLTGGIIRQMVSQKKFGQELAEEFAKVKGEETVVATGQESDSAADAKAGQSAGPSDSGSAAGVLDSAESQGEGEGSR